MNDGSERSSSRSFCRTAADSSAGSRSERRIVQKPLDCVWRSAWKTAGCCDFGEVRVLAVLGDAHHLDARAVAELEETPQGAGLGAEHLARELAVHDGDARRPGIVVPIYFAAREERCAGGAEISGEISYENGLKAAFFGPVDPWFRRRIC